MEASCFGLLCLQGSKFRWQAHIVDTFVTSDGLLVLQNLISARRPGHSHSLALIEAVLGVIAAVRCPLRPLSAQLAV